MSYKLLYPKNRSFLNSVVFVLMISWISMLISATCAMPNASRASSADGMPAGCSEQMHLSSQHNGHASMPDKDCSFKPCLDSHPNPAFEFKVEKPQIPFFALCLIAIAVVLLQHISAQRIRRATPPPIGRRILLIYRFCTLLN